MIPLLFVDDEPKVCSAAVRLLEPRGFAVDAHTDPEEFMREARTWRHRILVIDWNLRTCEGSDRCAELRSEGDTRPIALLSGKLATGHAKELARKCGADAFIEKTDVETWAPRLEELLRLPQVRNISGELRRPSLEIDGNVVRVLNYAATLGDKERAVLAVLAEEPGREYSREEIALRVWGRHGKVETTLVDNVISRIRKHLGDARDLIESTPNGWRIRVSGENADEKKLK